MCGIVVVLQRGAPVDSAVLERMRDAIAHRGPDDRGLRVLECGASSIGLAHRRQSVLDLSSDGAQPMSSPEGDVWIVFDGKIYNYIELRDELRRVGHAFRTGTDTEVLLAAYREWGQDCVARLNGMFAFVLFDTRQQVVFAARDRLGEKPLYLAKIDEKTTVLASEMKAIQAHSAFRSQVREGQLHDFLHANLLQSGRETLVVGIERVLAGEALELSPGGEIVGRRRYWTPDFTPSDRICSLDEAADQLRALLSRSVRLRLRSDAQIGVHLSGGLDSSFIAGLVGQHGSAERLQSYSVRFDDDETIGDGRYVDYMSQRLALRHRETTPNAETMVRHWDGLHAALEQPCSRGSIFNEYVLAKLAAEHGTKVILSGRGADELLCGHRCYFQFHQLDLLAAGRSESLERETSLLHWRLDRAAARYPAVERRFAVRPGYTLDYLWQRRAAGSDLTTLPRFEGVPDAATHGLLRRQLAIGLLHDQLPANLHISDRTGTAFGIETRFPFLDYDLLDWCLGVPNGFMIAKGWLKYVLREAARTVVPLGVRWRVDKVGFAAPQDRWLRDAPREWVRDLLFEGPITDVPGYDREALEALLVARDAGADTSATLWRWMSANQWLRQLRAPRGSAA